MRDYIQMYDDQRRRVIRLSIYLATTSLVFAAVARSPTFGVSGMLDLIEGDIHNGYVMVYGPVVVFLVFAWFAHSFYDCLAFQKQILADVAADQCSNTERFLLRLPYHSSAGRGISGVVAATLPLLITTVCYWTMVVEFLRCTNVNAPDNWPWDLLFGYGGWSGYSCKWHRRPAGGMPWIYPPYQTWAYLIGGAVLTWFTILFPCRVWRENTPLERVHETGRSNEPSAPASVCPSSSDTKHRTTE